MFKFVVFSALVAAAAAGNIAYPINYASPLSPLSYSYNGYNNIAYPSPILPAGAIAYPAPLTHLIKKRAAPLLNTYLTPSTYGAVFNGAYTAPLAASYSAVSPLAASYASPIATTYSSPLYTGHFIKKRSAPLLLPSSYVAPTTYVAPSPLITPTYTSPVISSPYLAAGPYAYTQFIKK